jgi:hypothetical protein
MYHWLTGAPSSVGQAEALASAGLAAAKDVVVAASSKAAAVLNMILQNDMNFPHTGGIPDHHYGGFVVSLEWLLRDG